MIEYKYSKPLQVMNSLATHTSFGYRLTKYSYNRSNIIAVPNDLVYSHSLTMLYWWECLCCHNFDENTK